MNKTLKDLNDLRKTLSKLIRADLAELLLKCAVKVCPSDYRLSIYHIIEDAYHRRGVFEDLHTKLKPNQALKVNLTAGVKQKKEKTE